jgi:hypothetical protein
MEVSIVNDIFQLNIGVGLLNRRALIVSFKSVFTFTDFRKWNDDFSHTESDKTLATDEEFSIRSFKSVL